MRFVSLCLALALILMTHDTFGQSASGPSSAPAALDGRRWNVSTGNLSVNYIQASPIGAHPRPNVSEAPPTPEQLAAMKANGLVAYEDYIAWGAIEREPGKWDFSQHDRICDAMKSAGMKYVIYDWVHFPPAWLRDGQKDQRTLMRCLEHDQETNYLSIFDPKTIAWYDHFYKALHDHFGDRIDDIYACILGPYGEGNYPLNVPDWVNIGHCHEGYWCGDAYARIAFQNAMKSKYLTIDALNRAWGRQFKSFDEVAFPQQIKDGFKPSPQAFETAQARRQWVDFITWYHQAIIDFAEKSIQTVLRYFPHEKVRTKPGGTARGINPVAWGTYSPGYAKMAAPYRIVLQPADCMGAVFGDQWLGTAYQFYGVTLGTEPAGGLDQKTFVRRMFSDAASGASQLFTYEFDQHVPEIRKYIHLYTGEPGETQVAVYCPTTLYRLGGDLQPTIQPCYALRDLCAFDVLDELLIADGALTPDRYKALILFQSDFIDQPICDKLDAFATAGGKILFVGAQSPRTLEGKAWKPPANSAVVPAVAEDNAWLSALADQIKGLGGVDGKLDALWTCRRGKQVLVYNAGEKPAAVDLSGRTVTVSPATIVESP